MSKCSAKCIMTSFASTPGQTLNNKALVLKASQYSTASKRVLEVSKMQQSLSYSQSYRQFKKNYF